MPYDRSRPYGLPSVQTLRIRRAMRAVGGEHRRGAHACRPLGELLQIVVQYVEADAALLLLAAILLEDGHVVA
eukprot:3171026-Prymnesium_polylepis.1